MEYLLILVVFTFPLVFYGVFWRRDYRPIVCRVGVLGTVIGAVWDWIAVNVLMLWSFNSETIVGVWFLGLPLEEWLFFPLISMALATLTMKIQKTFKSKEALDNIGDDDDRRVSVQGVSVQGGLVLSPLQFSKV